jgi:hypothetical protein
MEVAIALMLVVSGYLTIRKFQWIDIYVFDYQYHRDTCIERIKQPQITCDAVCVLHSVFITLYWLGIFLLCLLHLVFKVSPFTLDVVAIVSFTINVCLYVAHLLVRRILIILCRNRKSSNKGNDKCKTLFHNVVCFNIFLIQM